MFDKASIEKFAKSLPAKEYTYLQELGQYEVTVLNFKKGKNRDGEANVIAELLIEESSPVTALDGKTATPHAKGQTVSFCRKYEGSDLASGYRRQEIMGFVLRCLEPDNSPPPSNDQLLEVMNKTTTEPCSPLRGVRVGVKIYQRARKAGAKIGEPITKMVWSHIPQTPETIAENRKAVEARFGL